MTSLNWWRNTSRNRRKRVGSMEDDELIQKMEEQVNKKSPAPNKKRKSRTKESGPQLYARLKHEELVRLGYIK